MIFVDWLTLKSFVSDRDLSIQWIDIENTYHLTAIDGAFSLRCSIGKDGGESQTDFETNFKADGNKKIERSDSDTGGVPSTPKFAPAGWHQQYFETEFETCNSGAESIHEKDWENSSLGFSSLKFYKSVSGSDVECVDQADIDANCIRTDLLWMPPFDYSIKSGWIAQKSVPASNMYVWALGADLDAAYGGPQAVFAEGGINLTYVDARTKAGLDGVSATVLHYNHPQLGDGAGTNRIRFVVRHAVGIKHRLQAVFELFIE